MTADACQETAHPTARRTTGWPFASALAETAVILAALGWFYAAIFGVIRPDSLPMQMVSWIPLRRDTFGILCFVLSAAAYVIGGLLEPGRIVTTVVLRALFLFSTVIVVYLMVGTVAHPETVTMALTHVTDWPTERFTLWLALVFSATSFFLLRTSTHMSGSRLRRREVGF